MLCKNDNEWRRGLITQDDDYYDRYGDYENRKEPAEPRADLITIHIYKDQIVKLTEDVIRWVFHKIKGAFRKKKQKKGDARHDKEKEEE